MGNPYQSLPERAFWSPAVGKRHMQDIRDLWQAPFQITRNCAIATYGSCFAQHFSRALIARGFSWFDAEPGPDGMSDELKKRFNYSIFSSRTGNIYTASLLNQWTRWALGEDTPPEIAWQKDGRFYDPFRPVVEPDGFGSVDEMFASRHATIEAFGRSITECDIFQFTLGLTESWWDVEGGFEYPMCPGTAAGEFDAGAHEFRNQDYNFIRSKLIETIRMIRRARKVGPRVLLTVSPVPLTATNSGNHVLVATMESKSILRAVAGDVARTLPRTSYFPSYEIIAAPPFRGTFFEPNLRSVNPSGVDLVMKTFFAGLQARDEEEDTAPRPRAAQVQPASQDDVKCEEELLNAFGPAE